MSAEDVEPTHEKSLSKGLVAGLIGGIIGVAAMAAAEHLLPRRASVSDAQPEDTFALDQVHWSAGLALGAAYGIAAEYFPAATAKEGASFGIALDALAREGAAPALGLVSGSEPLPALAVGNLTSHIVYGVATEFVRSFVRKRL